MILKHVPICELQARQRIVVRQIAELGGMDTAMACTLSNMANALAEAINCRNGFALSQS